MTTAAEPLILELPRRLGGPMEVHYLVSDFTGTISVDGELVPGVAERLEQLAEMDLDIYYMTADTHQKVEKTLAGFRVGIVKVDVGEDKPDRIQGREFDKNYMVVMGNGHNDMAMFNTARFGIAVMEGEGLSGDLLGLVIGRGWPVVRSACDALDLLLKPKRLQATTRD